MTRTLVLLPLTFALAAAGCERERRSHREAPPGTDVSSRLQVTELQPGPAIPVENIGAFQENRWAIAQGQIYYMQFNCAGCHAPGAGGGIGPPLNDAEWIYGSEPEQVVASIAEGRPNGMPAFRGKINDTQMWQLAAYIRSLSGLTPRDTWPARSDHMRQATSPRDPGFRSTAPD
jgi:cytochrome c oxidase cbb3-type subunit III